MNTLRPPHTPLPIPSELVETLHQSNPWWRGKPAPPAPATRRHLVGQVHQHLDCGITPIVEVPGPHGAGKTTHMIMLGIAVAFAVALTLPGLPRLHHQLPVAVNSKPASNMPASVDGMMTITFGANP